MGQAKNRGSRDQRIAAAKAADSRADRVDLKAVQLDPGPPWQRFAQLIKVATANGARDVTEFARAFRQPDGSLLIRVTVKGLPPEEIRVPAGTWNLQGPEEKADALLAQLKGKFEARG